MGNTNEFPKYDDISLGLKGCMKGKSIHYFRSWIRDLIWEIKYAWQRAWRGYDNRDVFDLDICMRDRLIILLTELRNTHYGLFNVPEKYRGMFDKTYFNENQTDTIIDTMIYHLKMSNREYVEKVLYGKEVFEFNELNSTERNNMYKRAYAIATQNKDLAFDLIKDFFWELWD